jgi:hypothetical protein
MRSCVPREIDDDLVPPSRAADDPHDRAPMATLFGAMLSIAVRAQQPPMESKAPEARHAVMAVAWGYPVTAYAAFLGSLRRTGYSGAILLFEPRPQKKQHEQPPSKEVSEIVAMHGASAQRVDFPRDIPLYVGRFVVYARACREGGFLACMSADFRDVYFQENPFLRLPSPTPDLVLPLESKTIGKEPHNHLGVLKCYGADVVQAISNRTVACAGVLIGSPKGFEVLSETLPALVRGCHLSKGSLAVRTAKQLIADQAALNVFVYHHLGLDGSKHEAQVVGDDVVRAVQTTLHVAASSVSPALRGGSSLGSALREGLRVRFEAAGAGIVYTLGSAHKGGKAAEAFQAEHMKDGYILNADQTLAPVLHQCEPCGTPRREHPLPFAA